MKRVLWHHEETYDAAYLGTLVREDAPTPHL